MINFVAKRSASWAQMCGVVSLMYSGKLNPWQYYTFWWNWPMYQFQFDALICNILYSAVALGLRRYDIISFDAWFWAHNEWSWSYAIVIIVHSLLFWRCTGLIRYYIMIGFAGIVVLCCAVMLLMILFGNSNFWPPNKDLFATHSMLKAICFDVDFVGIGTILAKARGHDDELNTVASGTLSGLLFKSTGESNVICT